MSPPRRQRWQQFDPAVRLDLIADDLDELEQRGEERNRRVTQLLVTAAGLLVSVATGIVVLLVTGAVGR